MWYAPSVLFKNKYYLDHYRKLQMNIQYPGIHIIDTTTDCACNNLATT